MAIYLWVKRPFKTLLNEIQHFFFEAAALLTYMLSTAVSLLDDDPDKFIEIRVLLAKVIVMINAIFGVSVLVFAGLQIFQALWDQFRPKPSKENLKTSLRDKLADLLQNEASLNIPVPGNEGSPELKPISEDLEDSVIQPISRKVSFLFDDENKRSSPMLLAKGSSQLLSRNTSNTSLSKTEQLSRRSSQTKAQLQDQENQRIVKLKKGQRPNFMVSNLNFIGLQSSLEANNNTNQTMLSNNLGFEDSRREVHLKCQEREQIIASMRKASETDLFGFQTKKTFSTRKISENGGNTIRTQRRRIFVTTVRDQEDNSDSIPPSPEIPYLSRQNTKRSESKKIIDEIIEKQKEALSDLK